MTATIEVIASEGYRAATLARVAAHAGLSSTRLISYHFAGKDDLMRAVVGSVYGHIGPFVAERVARHDDQRSKLEAFIRSVVEFISAHRRADAGTDVDFSSSTLSPTTATQRPTTASRHSTLLEKIFFVRVKKRASSSTSTSSVVPSIIQR
ncbi:MAG: helix-turn-helix domain-containing protein [Rhodococcus sp. (in: high G+C Gram-positive bacteria)]|nr:helix-turn-helix domain-containing protein [Rhodococcus sp. (in: high G+C Gram-positive bacteria)]